MIDETIPADCNIRSIKKQKCQRLKEQLEQMRKEKFKVVTVLIGASEAVTLKLKERPQQITGTSSEVAVSFFSKILILDF